jgi:hypothetical protein
LVHTLLMKMKKQLSLVKLLQYQKVGLFNRLVHFTFITFKVAISF